MTTKDLMKELHPTVQDPNYEQIMLVNYNSVHQSKPHKHIRTLKIPMCYITNMIQWT